MRKWLGDLERPKDLTDQEYATFVRYCTEFFIDAKRLWRKDPNGHHKLVVAPEHWLFLISSAHDDVGHRGFYATNALISERYWWPYMGADIAWYIKTCHLCQIWRTQNVLIPPTVDIPAPLFAKVYIDTMFMLPSGGFKYILQARCSLCHYPEFATLRHETNKTVGEFLYQNLICRYSTLMEIVTDNGGTILKGMSYLAKKYGIRHIHISGYNS